MIKRSLAATFLTLSLSSQAAIIDLGNITRDTATSLDWLDVTASRGLSYNYVSAQFGVGGAFAGYRYATMTEMDTLIDHFGYVAMRQGCAYATTHCDYGIPGDSTIVETMIKTLGDLQELYWNNHNDPLAFSSSGAGFVQGMLAYSSLAAPGQIQIATIYDRESVYRNTGLPYEDLNDQVVTAYAYTNTFTVPNEFMGSFLVRPSAVPLPAASWLFMTALMGLVGKMRLSRR